LFAESDGRVPLLDLLDQDLDDRQAARPRPLQKRDVRICHRSVSARSEVHGDAEGGRNLPLAQAGESVVLIGSKIISSAIIAVLSRSVPGKSSSTWIGCS